MKSACFTGHRNISGDIINLKQTLYNTLEKYITNYGLTDFYAGGALGWDTLAALTVIKLRSIYPHIRLHLILPCSNEEQTAKWSDKDKWIFYRILSSADHIEYTSQYYYKGCMKARNARLVECADICFCYWNTNNFHSGTAQTVNMARKKHIDIINFMHDK